MGELITARTVASIPVNGRSYTDLLALQPGVIPASSQQPNAVVMSGCTNAPPSGDLNPGNMSVSGQRETANGFTVNGSSAQEDFNMGAAIVPNLDSIQEFRVLTSNFDAEYGNFSGGQVLVTTKSGTNELHGSAFEFLRNTNLDARNYFAAERAEYDRNQFGGTVGGPIRKDKVFFFADYQGTRMTQGVETGLISVPSLQNRAGDFSDIASSLTGTVNGQYWANLLSQKLGYTVHPGEPYYTRRLRHVRAVRAAERADSRSAPGPRRPRRCCPTSRSQTRATVHSPRPPTTRICATTRAPSKSTATPAGALFRPTTSPTITGWTIPIRPGRAAPTCRDSTRSHWAGRSSRRLGLTSTLGPTAINELRFGYMRTANNVGQPVGGVGPTLASQGFVDSAGKPGNRGAGPANRRHRECGVQRLHDRRGHHRRDAGEQHVSVVGQFLQGDGETHRSNSARAFTTTRSISIPTPSTTVRSCSREPKPAPISRTSCWASRATTIRPTRAAFYLRNKYVGLYGQDSWQVRPNLTLNYGLRWDLLPPWREKYNQFQTLVPGQQSVVLSRRAGWPRLPRRSGNSRHARAQPGTPTLRPRIGLAYSPDAQDQHARRLRVVLHRLRRPVGGHHERQPALWLRLQQPRAAAVRHAIHYRRQRAGRRAAVSGTDSGVRRLARRIRTPRSTGRSTCPLPACRRSSTKT